MTAGYFKQALSSIPCQDHHNHHLLCQTQVFLPSILELREGSTILTTVETALPFLAFEFVEEVAECLLGVMEV